MRWIVLILITLIWSAPVWSGGTVQVILSESGDAYEEAADAFKAAIGTGADVTVHNQAELNPRELRAWSRQGALLVPIGLKATRFVTEQVDQNAPILGLMVPMTSVKSRGGSQARGLTAYAFIDQPLGRSLALIETLLPTEKRVGVILSEQNGEVLQALVQVAEGRGIRVHAELVTNSEEVGKAIRRVLAGSDVFLLLPDSLVLSGGNLRTLLLASYRMRIPVIGFSAGLVKAGAVGAVYSSPSQIGSQGGAMARQWLASGRLPEAQYTSEFSVDFNRYVARSLGLVLPGEAEAVQAIKAQSTKP